MAPGSNGEASQLLKRREALYHIDIHQIALCLDAVKAVGFVCCATFWEIAAVAGLS